MTLVKPQKRMTALKNRHDVPWILGQQPAAVIKGSSSSQETSHIIETYFLLKKSVFCLLQQSYFLGYYLDKPWELLKFCHARQIRQRNLKNEKFSISTLSHVQEWIWKVGTSVFKDHAAKMLPSITLNMQCIILHIIKDKAKYSNVTLFLRN